VVLTILLPVSALQLPRPLVSAGWLAGHLGDPDLRVVDFRWRLGSRSEQAAYEAGHIPGAVYVNLESDVTGHVPGAGRHPLPAREAFEREMRAAGLGRDSAVVVYDDAGGSIAARLWWLLRYFGHEAVAVLDGGLQAWPGPLATGAETRPPGDFVAGPPREGLKVDFEDVSRLPAGSVLLDARAPERYRGEEEPVDPRAGHIPGARSAPWAGNLGRDHRFLDPATLRRRFEELGAGEGSGVVVYCGSGVTACHDLLALTVAGLEEARLYPGSWSDWSSRPETPAATGEQP
jgi:thiosulfate/3-mercaptopyruvate sulfurtransferase